MICCKEAASASNVIGEISKVTTEISGVSMMDEFARHARLQRKLIKLRDELKSESEYETHEVHCNAKRVLFF